MPRVEFDVRKTLDTLVWFQIKAPYQKWVSLLVEDKLLIWSKFIFFCCWTLNRIVIHMDQNSHKCILGFEDTAPTKQMFPISSNSLFCYENFLKFQVVVHFQLYTLLQTCATMKTFLIENKRTKLGQLLYLELLLFQPTPTHLMFRLQRQHTIKLQKKLRQSPWIWMTAGIWMTTERSGTQPQQELSLCSW